MNFSCPDNECHFKTQKIELFEADRPCRINQGAYGKWQQITSVNSFLQKETEAIGIRTDFKIAKISYLIPPKMH